MNDRELLELAAKAAGIEVTSVVAEGIPHRFGGGYWNPLTDDGDALRLAVTIAGNGWCFKHLDDLTSDELPCWLDESDPYAATRRAIVRAAAEIGKAM